MEAGSGKSGQNQSVAGFLKIGMVAAIFLVAFLLIWGPNLFRGSPESGDFYEMTWDGLDGKTIDGADWEGQVVILNFFATWCGPCLSEMPEFVEFYEINQADGLVMVGLSAGYETPDKIDGFVERFQVPFDIALGGESLLGRVGRGVLPTTVVLNTRGEISTLFEGAIGSEHLERAVAKAWEE